MSREWPGRDEHWLVRVIELVLDVPGGLGVAGECGVEGVAWEGRTLARPSSSWCSTFPGGLNVPGARRCRGVRRSLEARRS